jgi:DNA-binding MarR family transcriptional regulator
MADINSKQRGHAPGDGPEPDDVAVLAPARVPFPRSPRRAEPAPGETTPMEMIELLFFAYRDFVGDPDAILDSFGFGRAHHRVLHFVNRNPGMTVAELLDILRITKQSLGRVLRELLDAGYVVQQPGPTDRRQRLLYATDKGRALAGELAAPQSTRIRAALDALGPDAAAAAREFLRLMINEHERGRIASSASKP